jgi:2-oxoglutarate dehydrogenase E1 component
VLHDVENGSRYVPVANLEEGNVSFEIYNSPLSELAVLGFEYGFSVVAPKALVLWEAQFGDFVNAAQVIIDQFLVAGREKWAQESRLVLLLPHGYEGQGPEHSSARLERFLQLAAENNMRVANCTTPSQYFHLLRRQALLEQKRPLIVMTPKSLLRHPRAASSLEELTAGAFHGVLDDPDVEDARDIHRIVLCSGKIYQDLLAARESNGVGADVALVRVEQLYPFPAAELSQVLAPYANAREVAWVQEEPRNMGAWTFMEQRLAQLLENRLPIRYIGRVERASPSEGYALDHEKEQTRIVTEALAPLAGTRARGRSGSRRKSAQKAE